ncbi:MAG: GntP family permease [Lachnospiraceae bacterium]|nr:GntP family permease [Lachnospiraceae bacterium]
MLGLFGMLLGLAVLIVLAYKGQSMMWVGPVAALTVALLGGLELLPAYTSTYMSGLVGFVSSWFPMFMLGAMFGKIMEVTGSAHAIARKLSGLIGAERAIIAVVISCGLLVYGGISLFVVVFAIYPIAISLFREANLPRRLIPGCIACGAFTFSMTAFPGNPQLNNIIPTRYFGTNAMSGAILGIVGGLIMMVGGIAWLTYRSKKMVAAGEHFDEPADLKEASAEEEPNVVMAILPLIVVVLVLNVLPMFVAFPDDMKSTYSIIIALLCGIALAAAFNFGRIKDVLKAINDGASSSVPAIMNTSAVVGFGSVVKAVPAFAILTEMVLSIQASPLISLALSVTLLAGATGSSSGGMGIALEALGANYMDLAATMNIDPGAYHRIASIASGGLDSLPHCGAVITLLAVTGMNHKKSYADIGMVTVVIPCIATVVVVALGMMGIV